MKKWIEDTLATLGFVTIVVIAIAVSVGFYWVLMLIAKKIFF